MGTTKSTALAGDPIRWVVGDGQIATMVDSSVSATFEQNMS